MRNLFLVMPLLLTGCTADLCSVLLGTFEGTFGGDLEGTLTAVLSQDPNTDNQAVADFTLETVDATLAGDGPVYCEDGSLVIDLRNPEDDTHVGDVDGVVEAGTAAGGYALEGGTAGTWEY